MSIKARSSIAYRTGTLILLGASILTALSSLFFYERTNKEELESSNLQLTQLFTTVQSSAAVAAYLDNNEIALEVARGLASNDIVSGIEITSLTGMLVNSGSAIRRTAPDTKVFVLYSPFMEDDPIGQITIMPNSVLIKQRAKEAAWRHVILMSAHSFVLVALAILLVHRNLSQPIKQLSKRLHEIPPGSSERLSCPKAHQKDEIGLLVNDANSLIVATQNTLDGERRLREYAESLEKQFRLIFEKASCGIALLSQSGDILIYNPSFRTTITTDESDDELNTRNFFEFFANPGHVRNLIEQASKTHGPVNCDLQLSTAPEQDTRWLNCLISRVADENEDMIVEFIMYDISERARREQQNQFEAERDPLTQLYNRRAGMRHIDIALHHTKEKASQCAFLLVDLDKFKPVNDQYGHEAGDVVLKTIAKRLNQCLRRDDIIIRWGGDEFLVVVEGSSHISQISKKIQNSLHKPISLERGVEVTIGASIGIAIFPDHGDKIEDLIHNADIAMYQVKQSGRNSFALFDVQAEPSALKQHP